jgi:hypothetical protein
MATQNMLSRASGIPLCGVYLDVVVLARYLLALVVEHPRFLLIVLVVWLQVLLQPRIPLRCPCIGLACAHFPIGPDC